ncbi:MAG: 2TM domain-containing protein [Ramlibacter sp.]
MAPLNDAEIEHLARRRASARIGWIAHACVFLAVNLLHVAVAVSHGRMPSPVGIGMLAWAFGLALHGVSVFVFGAGSSLTERLVARERARLQAQRDPW